MDILLSTFSMAGCRRKAQDQIGAAHDLSVLGRLSAADQEQGV